MRILFVRHGKSVANMNTIVGAPDTPLAEAGLEQARVTGHDLRGHNVSTIVCSPFIRAQQTAEIIAGELGIPVQNIITINELHERRLGELENKPKTYKSEDYYRFDTEHGVESQQAVIDRMTKALAKVKRIAEKTGGTTLVVAHATSGFYFLQVAKGHTRFKDFEPVSHLGNAEFTEVELT